MRPFIILMPLACALTLPIAGSVTRAQTLTSSSDMPAFVTLTPQDVTDTQITVGNETFAADNDVATLGIRLTAGQLIPLTVTRQGRRTWAAAIQLVPRHEPRERLTIRLDIPPLESPVSPPPPPSSLQLEVRGAASDAQVSIDGTLAKRPSAVMLDDGQPHSVHVAAPGELPWSATVQLGDLPANVASAPEALQPRVLLLTPDRQPQPPPLLPPPPAQSNHWLVPASGSLAVVSLAGFALSLASYLVAAHDAHVSLGRHDELALAHSGPPNAEILAARDDLVRDRARRGSWETAAFVAGAGALVFGGICGLVLLLSGSAADKQSSRRNRIKPADISVLSAPFALVL